MKERPIIFNAPMVRAILANTKTQTRRVVKPQPETSHDGEPYWYVGGYRAWEYRDTTDILRKGGNSLRCPFGAPGDRLWVRESWRAPASCDHIPPRSIADSEARRFVADECVGPDAGFGKKRPSMFMPRWASRITLEVTGVRVERLHDISEGDAVAEGSVTVCMTPTGEDNGSAIWGPDGYCALWESINGPGSWDANPWLWAITFKRLEQP